MYQNRTGTVPSAVAACYFAPCRLVTSIISIACWIEKTVQLLISLPYYPTRPHGALEIYVHVNNVVILLYFATSVFIVTPFILFPF